MNGQTLVVLDATMITAIGRAAVAESGSAAHDALANELGPMLRIKAEQARLVASFPYRAPSPLGRDTRPIPTEMRAERERLRMALGVLNRKGK